MKKKIMKQSKRNNNRENVRIKVIFTSKLLYAKVNNVGSAVECCVIFVLGKFNQQQRALFTEPCNSSRFEDVILTDTKQGSGKFYNNKVFACRWALVGL